MKTKLRLKQLLLEISKNPISKEVTRYLVKTENKYTPLQPEYGGRLALQQALKSFNSGNYGVGAALFCCRKNQIEIFLGQNKIVTGKPTERFNTHAETDAIKHWLSYLEKNDKPNKVIKINTTNKVPKLILYTNLEPCPKCEMEITNLLRIARDYLNPLSTIQSISCATDGVVKKMNNIDCSNGSAHALGKKSLTSPLVWKSIQRGYFPKEKPVASPPIQFSLLNTSDASLQGYIPSNMFIRSLDKDLFRLSWSIFSETRMIIDHFLTNGNK